MIWRPRRARTPTVGSEELERARSESLTRRDRLQEHSTRARSATWRLALAVGAEQAEIRRNHLGELMHAALTAPGRHEPS